MFAHKIVKTTVNSGAGNYRSVPGGQDLQLQLPDTQGLGKIRAGSCWERMQAGKNEQGNKP